MDYTAKRFSQLAAVAFAFLAALPDSAVAQTPGAALLSETMTKQVWKGFCDPNFGSVTKTVYTPTNWFLPTDPSATVYFEVNNNLAATDQLTYRWIQPNGAILSSGSWPSASGGQCYSASLNIAGASPSSTAGTWHVRVLLNGSLLFDLPFTIGLASPGTPTLAAALTTNAGDPNSCYVPAPARTFLTTDQSIGLWFNVTGTNVGDFPFADWLAPDGTPYNNAWSPLTWSGAACFGAKLNGDVTVGAKPVVLSPGNWSVTVFWNNNPNTPLFTLGFTIAGGQPTPAIYSGGITNAAGPANGQAPVAPGSLISIYGTNLSTLQTGQPATTFPLPTLLGGSQVLMNGIAAPLVYVSAGQINAQVPWELAGATSLSVQVLSNGVASNTATTMSAGTAPGIFAVTHAADGSLVTSGNPAVPGEYLVIYCTGLGLVTNQPASGAVASGSALSSTVKTTVVTIAGVSANVVFSGLTPGFAGLYQVNVQAPANAVVSSGAAPATPGHCYSLVLISGGISAPAQCVPARDVSHLTFNPLALPAATAGGAYSFDFCRPAANICGSTTQTQIDPTGGVPPYHFQLALGSFPPIGLVLAPSGVISGTLDPGVNPGAYPFGVCAVDSAANSVCSQVSLTVNPAQQVNPPAAGGPFDGTYFGSIGVTSGVCGGVPVAPSSNVLEFTVVNGQVTSINAAGNQGTTVSGTIASDGSVQGFAASFYTTMRVTFQGKFLLNSLGTVTGSGTWSSVDSSCDNEGAMGSQNGTWSGTRQ
jgi:uncharacterized protein (TIGR03437 family)